MSLFASPRERSPEDVRGALSHALQHFDEDGPACRTLIRELLERSPSLFYSSAIAALKECSESRGAQFLVSLLADNGMLLEALCDPALSKEQAMTLGRAAVRADPSTDASLARGLADSETGQGTVLVRDAPRLMEILCEVGEPSRMMASMLRLLRHSNPYLRSKAVKVVGRGSKSAKWARQRLNEADPRIRANAIEALWSVSTEEARILLQFASADGNNRVAANALLGLYYLGDCASLNALVKMAQRDSPLFRSSAAWAMGETGDPRFTETLRRMLQETDSIVRKRALSALGKLKHAAAHYSDRSNWYVSARVLSGDSHKGTRRVMVAVAGDEAKELPNVPGLGFILSENGAHVTSYRVTERPAPGAMSVVFLLPREREAAAGLYESVENCLKWKRRSDLWCVLPYSRAGAGDTQTVRNSDPLPFSSNPDTLRQTLTTAASWSNISDLWTSLWQASNTDSGPSRGQRHIIVLSNGEAQRIAGHGLINAVRTRRLPVHAIATEPCGNLDDFCEAVRAPYHVCTPEGIGAAVSDAYLNLLARYEVEYQPVSPDATAVKVRVQAPDGWGETTVPYRAFP